MKENEIKEYKRLDKLSGRYNDLTNFKTGILTILYPVEKPSWAYDNSIYWMCECECGEKIVYAASRIRGLHPPQSCGCASYEKLDGKRFGILTVIKESGRDKNRKRLWLCKCDCGAEVEKEASSLIKGHTKSCGCLKHKKQDLVGQKFGLWTVISRSKVGKFRDVFWNCICDCGTEREVRGRALKSGESKSCGCLNRTISMDTVKDLTGQRFGRWTVLEIQRIKKNNKSRVFWLCRCDCGNEKVVAGRTLNSGHSQSCGCLHKESLSKANTLENGVAAFNKVYKAYKRGAKDRGLIFELTKEKFKEITKMDCYYCGDAPSNVGKSLSITDNYIYNGIDRLDNNVGYVIGNVVPCCKKCNMMKLNYSLEAFKDKIIKIYHKFILKEEI